MAKMFTTCGVFFIAFVIMVIPYLTGKYMNDDMETEALKSMFALFMLCEYVFLLVIIFLFLI